MDSREEGHVFSGCQNTRTGFMGKNVRDTIQFYLLASLAALLEATYKREIVTLIKDVSNQGSLMRVQFFGKYCIVQPN